MVLFEQALNLAPLSSMEQQQLPHIQNGCPSGSPRSAGRATFAEAMSNFPFVEDSEEIETTSMAHQHLVDCKSGTTVPLAPPNDKYDCGEPTGTTRTLLVSMIQKSLRRFLNSGVSIRRTNQCIQLGSSCERTGALSRENDNKCVVSESCISHQRSTDELDDQR